MLDLDDIDDQDFDPELEEEYAAEILGDEDIYIEEEYISEGHLSLEQLEDAEYAQSDAYYYAAGAGWDEPY